MNINFNLDNDLLIDVVESIFLTVLEDVRKNFIEEYQKGDMKIFKLDKEEDLFEISRRIEACDMLLAYYKENHEDYFDEDYFYEDR